MSGRDHNEVRHELGVYVLGALEPAERDRFERHLADCDECRDELASLAVLPSLLTRAAPDAAPLPGPPPLGPIVQRVAAERRRTRRLIRFTTAGAVAASLALVGVLSLPLLETAPAGRQFVADGGAGVTAAVEERAWGMAVEIAVADLPASDGYTAVAVTPDGHRTQVASWTATGRPVTVQGACYLGPGEVDRMEILAAPQERLLAVLRPAP